MAIIITGGAGYIGSHTVKYLNDRNEEVVIVDNFKTGHKEAVLGNKIYQIDIRDQAALKQVFEENKIRTVMHFAADSLVDESIEKPYEYYHNNVYGTLCLLNSMREHGVKKIIFSSSAAVYGEPKSLPIQEVDPTNPANTYGETKLIIEKMMQRFSGAYGINFVSLRYFNAAGADQSGKIGEDHDPETHLIPLILQVALGQRKDIKIFGNDYPTNDGTAVRDYIHVSDLAEAHYLALKYLEENHQSDIFNLANGQGFSVQEVIEVASKVTNQLINSSVVDRRAGDPVILVASAQKAKRILGWQPRFFSLEQILKDAWHWHKNNPDGFN